MIMKDNFAQARVMPGIESKMRQRKIRCLISLSGCFAMGKKKINIKFE